MNMLKSLVGGLLLVAVGCSAPEVAPSKKSQLVADMKRATDHHSFSKPNEAVTTHLKWDAKVDFDQRQITATATYQVQTAKDAERLLLDCRDLTIHSVTVDGQDATFELGPMRPFLGQPLSIPVTGSTREVSVAYTTSPDAAAFLWVEGESPFLFTQSQAKTARGFASPTKPMWRCPPN